MASRIGKSEDLKPTNLFNRFLIWFERQLDAFTNWYGKQLKWVLNHKLIFTGILVALFALTALMVRQNIIGKELIATGDQGKFRLMLEYDKGTSLKQNNLQSYQVEQFLLHQPDVAAVFSNVGGPSTGIGSLGVGSPNVSEFTIQLKPKKDRGDQATETYMLDLRNVLQKKFTGINFSMATLGLIPRSAPIELTISGASFKDVYRTAHKLQEVIQDIPGADKVQLSVEKGATEYRIVPDVLLMQQYGLTSAYVGMSLRNALTGNDSAVLSEEGTEYPIRIYADQSFRDQYEDLRNLTIVNPKGIPVKVSQFAKVVQEESPSLLERKDRQPAVTLTADALGRPSGSVADDVLGYLKNHPLPEGMEMTWGSDIKRQNDSFGALGSVLLISFILIYLIMVALYDSFIYPFVVLFSIPVAVIGAFLALNLSQSHLSLFALLGLIMLMGLVVKNAILIVDFTNQLKAQGMYYKEALVEAGKGRMRPILMTSISMIVGMLPIALAQGTASEWKNGLAWVIIGGVTSSLILTVYLVPVVYYVVDAIKEYFAEWKQRKTAPAHPEKEVL
jgi:HAE1 family hydrophobic/amphiphilic exporter-1